MQEHSTFGHTYDAGKNIYFEEYDKSFLNKEGPGPAHYNPNESAQSIHQNAPKHRFSTSSRWMLIKDTQSTSPKRSKLFFIIFIEKSKSREHSNIRSKHKLLKNIQSNKDH